MNYGQSLEDKWKGMQPKYAQAFIDAQKRLLEAQKRKIGLLLTPGDKFFLRSIGVQLDPDCL